MNYLDFASDLPVGRTDISMSPEELEEKMRRQGVGHYVQQLGRGQFRGDLTTLSMEQATFAADRYNTASAFRLESTPDTICLLLLRSADKPIRVLGTDTTRRNLVLLPAASGIDILAPKLSGSEAIMMPKHWFAELMRLQCPAVQLPKDAVVLKGEHVLLDTIRNTVLQILAHPECVPDQGFVSNVVSTVIGWMGEALGHHESKRLPDTGSRRRVVERARAFIETHYRQPIRMEDLCRVTKVTTRTLQRCFRHYFGLTITEYINAVRFEATRRDLAAAHPTEQTVARIALNHGFTHLGRFSVEFKQRFGFSAYSLLAERRPGSPTSTSFG